MLPLTVHPLVRYFTSINMHPMHLRILFTLCIQVPIVSHLCY